MSASMFFVSVTLAYLHIKSKRGVQQRKTDWQSDGRNERG